MNHTTSKRVLALAAASAFAIVVTPGAAADPTDCGMPPFPLVDYAACVQDNTGVDCHVTVSEGFAACKANPDLVPDSLAPSGGIVQWAACGVIGDPVCSGDPAGWVDQEVLPHIQDTASWTLGLAEELACFLTYDKVC